MKTAKEKFDDSIIEKFVDILDKLVENMTESELKDLRKRVASLAENNK